MKKNIFERVRRNLMKNDVVLSKESFNLIIDDNVEKYEVVISERADGKYVIVENSYLMKEDCLDFEENPYNSTEKEMDKKEHLHSALNLTQSSFILPEEFSVGTFLKFIYCNCNKSREFGHQLMELCDNEELKVKVINNRDYVLFTKNALEVALDNE